MHLPVNRHQIDLGVTGHPRKKALLVDAVSSSRVILRSQLEKIGYQTIQATNGEQALEEFRRERPDIIFIDDQMSMLGGHQTVGHIRAIDTADYVPIVFITSLTDESSLTRCIEVGGDDFLSRPVDHLTLKAKVLAMERIRSVHERLGRLYGQMKKDEETAASVFSGAVAAHNVAMHQIRSLLRPADVFSGDVLLSAYTPSGDLNVILGDFTGHGLAAALGALPASETFRAMTGKGFSPPQILSGINDKLTDLLPTSMFFAVQFVSLKRSLDQITVCNCGMPDILLIDRQFGTIKQRFKSSTLPLSITRNIDFHKTIEHFPIARGDRILLVSDGVLESRNPTGEYYGQSRLEDAITKAGRGPGILETITGSLDDFCLAAPRDDDISLAEIPCESELLADWEKPLSSSEGDLAVHYGEQQPAADLTEFSLVLSGARLRETDPIPTIINHIQELTGLRSQRRALFTVLTELYVNALDHGVLGLDSNLKRSQAGFARYYQERKRRLTRLENGFVSIQIKTSPTQTGGSMTIQVADSGAGFDFDRHQQSKPVAISTPSGRGIGLVCELCETLRFESPGNLVEAVFSWVDER